MAAITGAFPRINWAAIWADETSRNRYRLTRAGLEAAPLGRCGCSAVQRAGNAMPSGRARASSIHLASPHIGKSDWRAAITPVKKRFTDRCLALPLPVRFERSLSFPLSLLALAGEYPVLRAKRSHQRSILE